MLDVRGINSAWKGDGERVTTITITFVSTVGVPTSTAHSTEYSPLPSSSLSTRLLSQPAPFGVLPTPSRPIPSSTPPAAEPSSGPRSAFPSPVIIGITIAVVVLLFILASYVAWRRRRRTRGQADGQRAKRGKVSGSDGRSRAGVRPVLLPRFSFEKGKAPRGTQRPTSHVDKFTAEISSRLNKPMASSGVADADDRDRIAYQIKKLDAPRGNMVVYAPSFGLGPPTKAMVVNTFITDLTDELPVIIGQRLGILAKYDDGWTFCVNEKGEQGMVPIECLAVYREGAYWYNGNVDWER